MQVPATSGSTVLFVPKAEPCLKDFDVSCYLSLACTVAPCPVRDVQEGPFGLDLAYVS